MRRVIAALSAIVATAAFVAGTALRTDAPRPSPPLIRPAAGEPSDVELQWPLLDLTPGDELDPEVPLEPGQDDGWPRIIPIP